MNFNRTTYYQYSGEPLTITALVSGNPSPSSQWSRDGMPLMNSTRVKLFDDSIVFDPVMDNDNGTYTLTGTNSQDVTSSSVDLVVICKFFFTSAILFVNLITADLRPGNSSTSINLQAGDNYTFECTVTASNPPLDSLRIMLPGGTDPDIIGPMTYFEATPQTGEYVCIARNPYISARWTFNINVVTPTSGG